MEGPLLASSDADIRVCSNVKASLMSARDLCARALGDMETSLEGASESEVDAGLNIDRPFMCPIELGVGVDHERRPRLAVEQVIRVSRHARQCIPEDYWSGGDSSARPPSSATTPGRGCR